MHLPLISPSPVPPLTLLQTGEISLEGQFLWGSNYTVFVKVCLGNETTQAVYKPTRGERPLWDFPAATLALREVAAYLVSEQLGWQLVPPTILREDGPLGPGSLQLYMEHDENYHYFNFTPEDRQRLRTTALFDFIINNADRKGGHILKGDDGHLWLIDHGICFHEDPKLRTVIWDFAGEPLPDALCADLHRFREQLEPGRKGQAALEPYLISREINALARRTDRLLSANIFPRSPRNARPYPWPLV